MPNLINPLKTFLAGADAVAILGVGSELRADDYAGMLVAEKLKKLEDRCKTIRLKVFMGHTAPENLTGEIRKFKPTHLIIIDTADIGGKPGGTKVFAPDETSGITFSTHKLPIKVMISFLRQELDCSVVVIGIQPKTLDFGKPVSKEIEQATRSIRDEIIKALNYL